MAEGPWREPPDETEDYPNLVVHDGRITGQISVGHSRLPLSSVAVPAIAEAWESIEDGWAPGDYGFTEEDLMEFVGNLLEQRGEFARLLCVLADVERRESEREDAILSGHADDSGFAMVKVFPTDDPDSVDLGPAWWELAEDRERVIDLLWRCLYQLGGVPKSGMVQDLESPHSIWNQPDE